MKYCSECGQPVSRRIPEGDNLPRFVCDSCHTIHYQNPNIVAGCVLTWENRILLCRRAIEPRHGLWTLPAGFMENGETTAEAAAREAWEEAGARSPDLQLYSVHSLPHISQVYIMFRGELEAGHAEAGPESLEVALVEEADIPWDQLAFPVVREVLERFLEDRRRGHFPVHGGDIVREGQNGLRILRYAPD